MYLNLSVNHFAMSKLKGRSFVRKDVIAEIRGSLGGISEEFLKLLPEDARVETCTAGDSDVVLVNGEALIFKFDDGHFPTVRAALKINSDKRVVTVDRGAVKHIISGANVMRPGVVSFDREIKKGDFVVVSEHASKKAIAVGISLWDGGEFEANSTGKCVKNIHHVGDEIWNAG